MSISVSFPPSAVLTVLLIKLKSLDPDTVTAEELIAILDTARDSL